MLEKLYSVTPQMRKRIIDILSVEIAREPRIAFAFVYGSLLERDAVHDVDLGIYLDVEPLSVSTEYAFDLSERLSRLARIPVDVRVLNKAPNSFVYHALRGKLIYCRDENRLSDVIEETAARYLDIAPVLRHATREAHGP
jgi:predicted nucleotidyltransferase